MPSVWSPSDRVSWIAMSNRSPALFSTTHVDSSVSNSAGSTFVTQGGLIQLSGL